MLIQTLWIEGALSTLERLSLCSFLHHGHQVDLYHYGDLFGVPPGVRLRPAAEILPAERIFRYPKGGGLSGFANLFRYKLLLDRGGWWSDLDEICLRPFPQVQSFATGSERRPGKSSAPINGVLFAERGHEAIRFLYEEAAAKNPQTLQFGETGPELVAHAIRVFGLEDSVLPPDAFCPLDYMDFRSATTGTFVIPESSYGVHLWNELWRESGLEKNAAYSPDSLFEVLKSSYLP